MKDENCNSVLTMMGYDTDIESYSSNELDCLFEDLESVNNAINVLIDELWDKN